MINKTLLINLKTSEIASTLNFTMPIGILSLASYLETNNEEVEILDLNVNDDLLIPYIERKYKFIGISIMISAQFNKAYEIVKLIKILSPETKIIIGGTHITQFKNDIEKNCKEIDFVIAGEGEQQLLNIVRDENKDIYFIEDENLPIPAYHKIDFKDYKRDTTNWNNPYSTDLSIRVPIITSRGCPNQCNFCSLIKHMGNKYRPMSINKAVDMLEYLNRDFGATYFAIYDANFMVQTKRVIEIANEIVKRNLKIYLDLPTGLPINDKTKDIVDALVQAGLIRTTLSIESGNEYVRNTIMKKKSKQTDIFSAIESIRKYPQIYLLTDFVIGMPEETIESLQSTYNLLLDLDTDDITISIATPYPNTKLYDQCIKDNLFLPDIKIDELYKSSEFCHANLKRFNIRPYNLSIQELIKYRDKFIELKKVKLENYKNRINTLQI
jgi:radical SAM superfamily enzyme YgiQ (UPF0313 family)